MRIHSPSSRPFAGSALQASEPPLRTLSLRGLVLLWAIASLVSCGAFKEGAFELRGQALGTSWFALISDPPAGVDQSQVRSAIDQALAEMDRLASDWRPDSELSTLNQWLGSHPVGARFDLSPELCQLLSLSDRVHGATRGAFDPSVAELVGALGFGARARPTPLEPGPALEAIRARIGWQRLGFEGAGCSLTPEPGAAGALDLSGIAKGAAVDGAARALRALGIEDFLLEVGGELVLAGKSPRGDTWMQGVDWPTATPNEPRAPALRFMATDVAVATSGDYRQWTMLDGRRISHVVDPRAGAALESRVASVTVLSLDCATADAYATGLMVLGVQEGMRAAAASGEVEALFIEYEPTGGFRLTCTPGFPPIELAPEFRSELHGRLPGQVMSTPLR